MSCVKIRARKFFFFGGEEMFGSVDEGCLENLILVVVVVDEVIFDSQ